MEMVKSLQESLREWRGLTEGEECRKVRVIHCSRMNPLNGRL